MRASVVLALVAASSLAHADEKCRWFPNLMIRDHEGGGRYGAMHDGRDQDITLDYSSDEAMRIARRYGKLAGLPVDDGAGGLIDCGKARKVKSDRALLAAVRKKKEDPERWLAAVYIAGEDWETGPREDGVPINKDRAVIVFVKENDKGRE
jgi:hypothetical protein